MKKLSPILKRMEGYEPDKSGRVAVMVRRSKEPIEVVGEPDPDVYIDEQPLRKLPSSSVPIKPKRKTRDQKK